MSRWLLIMMTLAIVMGSVPLPSSNRTSSVTHAQNAEAKKPSKERRKKTKAITRGGCDFRVRGSRWKLLRNCAATDTISLPRNVKLDGNRRIVTISGNLARYRGQSTFFFPSGTITVKNLNVDAKNVTGDCRQIGSFSAIYIEDASGVFDGAHVSNLVHDGGCTAAITVNGRSRFPQLTFRNSSVINSSGYAFDVFRVGQFRLTESSILSGGVAGAKGVSFFMSLEIEVTNSGIDVSRDEVGIRIVDVSNARVADNHVATLTGDTFGSGVYVWKTDFAQISANIIGEFACGIKLSGTESEVVIDPDNSFIGPGESVCETG